MKLISAYWMGIGCSCVLECATTAPADEQHPTLPPRYNDASAVIGSRVLIDSLRSNWAGGSSQQHLVIQVASSVDDGSPGAANLDSHVRRAVREQLPEISLLDPPNGVLPREVCRTKDSPEHPAGLVLAFTLSDKFEPDGIRVNKVYTLIGQLYDCSTGTVVWRDETKSAVFARCADPEQHWRHCIRRRY